MCHCISGVALGFHLWGKKSHESSFRVFVTLLGKMLLFTDGFTNFSQFGCQFGGFSGFLHFLVPLSLHVFVICDKDVELIGTWIKPLGVNTYQSQSCFSRTARHPPSAYHTKPHDWWWRLLFISWLAHWFSLWSSENKCVLALRVLWRAGWHRRVWASLSVLKLSTQGWL